MIKRKRQRKNSNFPSFIKNYEESKVENNNTFYKIVQNIAIPTKNNSILEYDNKEIFNFEVHSFFFDFQSEKNNLSKFYDCVSNKYLSPVSFDLILDKFCHIKRTYNALKLFENICYWKYSSKYQNEEDLCMNSLERFSSRSLIKINQNKTIYVFRISDLLKHINSNLIYTTNYIHEPKISKNPYNNIEFKLHDYYNIYIYAKQSDYIIPPLYHLFFLENFNINRFAINHYPYIRDIFIRNEYNSFTPQSKSNQIRKMIIRNKKIVSNIIDPEFPINILNDAMGHILLEYLYFRYTLNDQILHESMSNYQKKLVNFFKFNRNFGRRKLIRVPTSVRKFRIQYETTYPTIGQLKILCNKDHKIYDDVQEQNILHISDTDSDSDTSTSSMSNELANNQQNIYQQQVEVSLNNVDTINNNENNRFLSAVSSLVQAVNNSESIESHSIHNSNSPNNDNIDDELPSTMIEELEQLQLEINNDDNTVQSNQDDYEYEEL